MKLVIAIFVCAAVAGTEASADVMKEMTLKFGKALEECKNEHNLPDSAQQDFINFWKEGYELKERTTGCAIMCVSSKLNLHDDSGKLHEGNAMEFAKSHGADDTMAKTLIDLVHDCDNSAPPNDDKCLRVLEIAKCFKAGVHKLNWAPNMEFLAEM